MGDRKQDRERRLVEQCRSGSSEAWNELYREYYALVRSIVKGRLGKADKQEIEDATQDVFMELIAALERFDCSYGLSQFICGVAKRTARGEVRYETAGKRTGTKISIGNPGGTETCITIIAPEPSPEEEVSTAQLSGLLRTGFAGLSDKCREIIHYRDFQELSYEEIAKILGEKVNTVTKRRERCLEQLTALCHTLLREECTR